MGFKLAISAVLQVINPFTKYPFDNIYFPAMKIDGGHMIETFIAFILF